MYINLMPLDYIARQTFQRQLRVWACIFVVLIACVALYCGKSLAKVISLQRQIAELSIKHPGLRRMNDEVGLWEQELATAKAKQEAVERLRNDKRALTLVGIVARSVDEAEGKSRLQHLSIRLPESRDAFPASSSGSTRPIGPASTKDAAQGTVTLDGIADDADTISRLVNLLRQSGTMSEVSLKGSSEVSTSSDHYRQFTIECNFE